MASKKDKQIAVRVDGEQMARLNRVFEQGRSRSLGAADNSAMLRELLGIVPFHFLKEEDRLLLRENVDQVNQKELRIQHEERRKAGRELTGEPQKKAEADPNVKQIGKLMINRRLTLGAHHKKTDEHP